MGKLRALPTDLVKLSENEMREVLSLIHVLSELELTAFQNLVIEGITRLLSTGERVPRELLGALENLWWARKFQHYEKHRLNQSLICGAMEGLGMDARESEGFISAAMIFGGGLCRRRSL